MANLLDEQDKTLINEEGTDVHVINKKLPVTVGTGTKVFEFFMWFPFVIPGIVLAVKKRHAKDFLLSLEQKLQHDASSIDNYMVQRVTVLENTARLLEKSIELDKTLFNEIAKTRSGKVTDDNRNEVNAKIDQIERSINVAVEAYPELKAHADIQEAMQQNRYLQELITAAREVYNDTVYRWNSAIQEWPTKRMVAAKEGYTTRIPFTASKEIKDKAEKIFF